MKKIVQVYVESTGRYSYMLTFSACLGSTLPAVALLPLRLPLYCKQTTQESWITLENKELLLTLGKLAICH